MKRVIDDTVVEMRLMTGKDIPEANRFADRLVDDRNFTHFRHTRPAGMLTRHWEVYIATYGDIVVSWGQVQKFPENPHKQHVCRVGFATIAEFRGRGFGGRLVDFTLGKCVKYKKVTATTFSDNIIMLGMFLRRGFVIEGFFTGEEYWDNRPRHVISLARYQNGSGP